MDFYKGFVMGYLLLISDTLEAMEEAEDEIEMMADVPGLTEWIYNCPFSEN